METTGNPFSIIIDKGQISPTVRIQGEVDIHTCPELNQQLNLLISEGHKTLILNLEKVHYIDSTGLGIIAHAARNIQTDNGKLVLISSKPQIKKLIDMSGLKDKNIRLFETESSAVESLVS